MLNFAEYGIDPQSRLARMRRIAAAVAAAWKAEAQESGLSSTLREYKRGVIIREISENSATVALVGELPNLLERGIPPHDMRDYLLKTVRAGASPIRRVKSGPRKGQPYRYIMFRRTVEEIRRMGGSAAYREAQSLDATVSSSLGKLIYGSRMREGASQHYISRGGVRSVSDATAGMVRLVATTTAAGAQGGTNTTYAAWRTVSTKRPEAWQHSGYTALRLAARVEANIHDIIEAAGV